MSEHRAILLDAMDVGACENGVGHGTADCWRHRAILEAAWDAALAARIETECSTCQGHGYTIRGGSPDHMDEYPPCTACGGSGRQDQGSRLLAALVEAGVLGRCVPGARCESYIELERPVQR